MNNFCASSNSKNQNISPKFTSSPCNQHVPNNASTATSTNLNNDSPTNPSQSPLSRPLLRTIYERKPIKLNDLKYCKLIGLNLLIPKDGQCCSMDCNEKMLSTNTSQHQHHHRHYHVSKTQDDTDLLLKYVPITIRNYVSIFDLDKKCFEGPKYKGHYLNNCLQKCRLLSQDSICYLFLLAHVVKYYVKVAFLYNYSILFDSSENVYETKHRQRSISNIQPIKTTRTGHRPETKEEDSLISSLNSSKTMLEQFNSNDQLKKERVLRYYSIDYVNNNLSDTSSYSLASSIGSIASAIIGGGENKSYKQLRRHSTQHTSSHDDIDLLRSILANVTSSNYNNNSAANNTDLTSESLSNFSMENSSIITTSSTSMGPSNGGNSTNNFDDSDLNIVVYILKSLKIKQMYLYNLAMQKKKLKQVKMMIKDLKSSDPIKCSFETDTNTEMSAGSSTMLSSPQAQAHLADAEKSTEKKTDYLNLLKEQKLFINAQIHNNIQLPLLIEYEESTLFHSKK